jgi:hypothetical protein
MTDGATEGQDPKLAGAVVVVVGEDAARVGSSVAALEARGVRVAGFVGDAASAEGGDALAELVAELFPAHHATG